MPGTRAKVGGDGEIRASHAAVYGTAALPVGATSPNIWPGREADDASSNSTLPSSHRSAGMSHAPSTVRYGDTETRAHGDKKTFFPASPLLPVRRLVPKEGLKPSTSGL